MLSPVEQIKSKLDIVDVISEYFPLKQAGVNFKARCPFHEEKTPSFMVNKERQFYHCFGCSESGDIFSFIQKMENIEFPEALKILANKAGVKLPEYNPELTNLKTRIIDIQYQTAEWFYAQLTNSQVGKKALNYLKDKRKLTDKTIKEWQLGYAPESWDALTKYLKSKNFTDQEILQSGLVVAKAEAAHIQNSAGSYYDRFRDRIMFPIEDYHGNVVGFTGRALRQEEAAKYINSPQTLAYNKSEAIFGLYKAKQAIKDIGKVIIVEGNMDVVASHQAGVVNVVAVSGTALTFEQIKILQRYTNNIIFAFDADEAGLRATERSIVLAWQQEANVRVIAFNKSLGKDPDEIIQKDPAKWQLLINSAQLAMDYFFEVNFSKYKDDSIESKKEIANRLINLIIKIVNPVEQDYYIKKLAERLEVNELFFREAVNNAKKKLKIPKSEKSLGPERLADKTDKSSSRAADRRNLIAERLMACLFIDVANIGYANDKLLIEYLPLEFQELYKLMVVYYTKKYHQGLTAEEILDYIRNNYPDLKKTLNKMIILKEGELANLSDSKIMSEINKYITELKIFFIKAELAQIEKQIKERENKLTGMSVKERQKEEKNIDELLARFSELSAELKGD